MWKIYDKETNSYCWDKLLDYELCEFVRYIAHNELDRASFYEFENDSGEICDCWDINRKFNLNIKNF